MKRVRSNLSINAMRRIMKKAGAGRISDKAAEQLAIELEGIAHKIVRSALQYAMHSRRSTLMAIDIEVAARKNRGIRPA